MYIRQGNDTRLCAKGGMLYSQWACKQTVHVQGVAHIGSAHGLVQCNRSSTLQLSTNLFFKQKLSIEITPVNSGGFRRAPPARIPYGPKFSQFHTVSRKIWQNHMLASPWRVGTPLLRGIMDPPLVNQQLINSIIISCER